MKYFPKIFHHYFLELFWESKGIFQEKYFSYFSDAGVMHLFAISALHVGIIFSAVYKLFDAFNVSHITSFIIGSFTSIFLLFSGWPDSICFKGDYYDNYPLSGTDCRADL